MILAYNNQDKINFTDYIIKRIARIYPLFIFAGLLMVIYFYLFKNIIDYQGIILNILTIQAWVPTSALSINFTGWSISVEFFFYLIFPFLFNKFYKKIDWENLFLPIVSIWFITQLFMYWFVKYYNLHGNEVFIKNILYYLPLLHLNEFLMGNLAAIIFLKHFKNRLGNYDKPIIILTILLIIILKKPLTPFFHNGIMAILFIPIIFLMAMNNGFITKISNHKFAIFLGEISFGIYILQSPAFGYNEKLLNYFGIFDKQICFYTGFVFLIVLSIICHFCIEKPMNKLINYKKQPVKI